MVDGSPALGAGLEPEAADTEGDGLGHDGLTHARRRDEGNAMGDDGEIGEAAAASRPLDGVSMRVDGVGFQAVVPVAAQHLVAELAAVVGSADHGEPERKLSMLLGMAQCFVLGPEAPLRGTSNPSSVRWVAVVRRDVPTRLLEPAVGRGGDDGRPTAVSRGVRSSCRRDHGRRQQSIG